MNRFREKNPDNNRSLRIVLTGNGERVVFYRDKKFYKNESKADEGRELKYIKHYDQFAKYESNLATHWVYI